MNVLIALICCCIGQGADGKLAISNVHPTIGALGAARNDNSYLPGDLVHVAFDVSGLKLDGEDRYRVGAKLTVEDATGKVVASEDYGAIPPRLGVLAGGKSRFAFRYLIPGDLAAGSYKARLLFTDVTGKQESTAEQAFKVSPPGFGLIRFQAGRGPFGQAETPCTGSVGEVLYLRVMAVGLSKGKEGQGSLDVAMEVQDAQGKPIGKPQTTAFPGVNANEPLLLQFELPLDQAGKYKVTLKATDKPSNRSATMTIPVTVVD
jgi:hypothetical protein